MFSVFAGTLLLAIVHALIPNHWLPLVAVARAEKCKQKDVTVVTFLAALAHVTGTVILGLVLGLIGKELQEEYGRIIFLVSSVLLIVFGLIYFTVNLPHHHHSEQKVPAKTLNICDKFLDKSYKVLDIKWPVRITLSSLCALKSCILTLKFLSE